MRKLLRYQALRGVDRLITGTLGDQKWYVPGGWFATTHPIYDGYRVLKSQMSPDECGHPDMTAIVTGLSVQKHATERQRLTEGDAEFMTLRTIDEFTPRKVSALYFDFLTDIHPDAEIRVSENEKFAPVGFYENNNLVALLMPVKG